MDSWNRKRQRLSGYDYSQNNAYFVTICTQSRRCIFGDICDDSVNLNHAGEMVADRLSDVSNYGGITIHKYVVMPNHIHAIIVFANNGTTQGSFPTKDGETAQRTVQTLSEFVQRYKTITTKMYIDGVKSKQYPPFDKKIWQKSFHDHIIRNESECERICQYIDENPIKWREDEYFTGSDI